METVVGVASVVEEEAFVNVKRRKKSRTEARVRKLNADILGEIYAEGDLARESFESICERGEL